MKPKLKNIAAALPKKARQQLLKQYKESAHGHPSQRPEHEGVKGYEKGVQVATRKALGIAKKLIGRKKSVKRINVSQKPLKKINVTRKAVNKTKNAWRRKKAAQQSAKAVQKVAKTVASLSKKVAMAVAKATAAAGKSIVAALAACGPVVVIIIAVALIAAILASSLGLFFSGETGDADTISVRQVVEETASEFSLYIESIIANNPHNELDVQYYNNGTLRADNWVDVLAVFAVKTTTSDDGMDVLTIDTARVRLLKETFGHMHTTEYHIEEVESIEPLLDIDGNDTGELVTVYTNILHICIIGKSAWEQADNYYFSTNQREQLSEILSSEYNSYWANLIGMVSMSGNGTGVVGSGNFIWPCAASDYITSPFGSRTHPTTGEWNNHTGIDISAGLDTGVLAADDGIVTIAGWHWSYGNYIEINHGNGMRTRYAHCNMLLVSVGDPAARGDTIALVGNTGVSTGPHLHFEVFIDSGRIDPLQFFSNYTTAW